MKQTLRLACYCLCVLHLSTASSSADVYRWTDDNGKVVFGDTPPKDKTTTAVDIKNTEKSGTQFATPEQTKDIERDAQNRRSQSAPTSHQRVDPYCRRYVSELNKIEIFLEHTVTTLDQHKARDLRKLIKKECGKNVLTKKFDDGSCTRYRKELSKTKIFLEHSPNPRDEHKVKDLEKQIARECQ